MITFMICRFPLRKSLYGVTALDDAQNLVLVSFDDEVLCLPGDDSKREQAGQRRQICLPNGRYGRHIGASTCIDWSSFATSGWRLMTLGMAFGTIANRLLVSQA
jgi:hypothetical protein